MFESCNAGYNNMSGTFPTEWSRLISLQYVHQSAAAEPCALARILRLALILAWSWCDIGGQVAILVI